MVMEEKDKTLGYLNKIIERYKSFLLNIEDVRGQLPQIFNLRDEIEKLLRALDERGIDLSVERSKLEFLDHIIKDKARFVLKNIKKLVDITSYRKEQKIPSSHWWWYLDEFLKGKRRVGEKRWLIRSGIIGGILICIYLILQFVIPEPSPWAIHQEKGERLLQEGNLDGALQEYKKAIQLAPGEAINHLFLGIIYERKKMPSSAQSYFERAKKLYPNPVEFYLQRGMIYLQGGKLDEAEKDAEQALKIDPESAYAHFLLGNVYEVQNKIPLAVAEFQIVSQIKDADSKLVVISRYKLGMLMLQGAARSPSSQKNSLPPEDE